MAHHTKDKGDLAVLKVQLDLLEHGFILFTTSSEHSPIDLIAYKDSALRLQVKYRKTVRGCINVTFRSTWADRNGSHVKKVDKQHIDLYAVYCPDTDKCYYFDPRRFNKGVTLRVEATRSGQRKRVHDADNFRAPVAQGIEQRASNSPIRVGVPAGAPNGAVAQKG